MKAALTINIPSFNVSIIGRINKTDLEKNYDCLAYIPADIMPYLCNVHFDIRTADTGSPMIEINKGSNNENYKL